MSKYVKLLGIVVSLMVGPVRAETALISVASNFSGAFEELEQVFEMESGHLIETVFGSSGRFFAQINNGAPFHAFLSADQEKPDALQKAGLVVEESRFTYALGKLVLWSSQSNLVDSSGQVLKQNNFRRLAIANPRLAPYGIAAMEVLENLDLASGIQGKIIQGENIAQTYQFVSTGNVELGLVAFSQVYRQDRIVSGSSWIIPADLYNPVRQDAVLLRRGANNQAAIAFLKFIRSEAGRAIIESFGYQVEKR